MKSVSFVKLHGLGNDFICFDGLTPSQLDPDTLKKLTDAKVVENLCNRNRGIGGDGVIIALPSTAADAKMRIINSDGSEPEMCGNGVRCLAKMLYDRHKQFGSKKEIIFETLAGNIICKFDPLVDRADEIHITVDMGAAKIIQSEQKLSSHGQTWSATLVSTGNPHAIIWIDDLNRDLTTLAKSHGPILEKDPVFPHRSNIEFARMSSAGTIDLVVWERGAGLTQACGTGACATVVAAIQQNKFQFDKSAVVNLPGGSLSITVENNYRRIWMTGPATDVFSGTINL